MEEKYGGYRDSADAIEERILRSPRRGLLAQSGDQKRCRKESFRVRANFDAVTGSLKKMRLQRSVQNVVQRHHGVEDAKFTVLDSPAEEHAREEKKRDASGGLEANHMAQTVAKFFQRQALKKTAPKLPIRDATSTNAIEEGGVFISCCWPFPSA